MESTKQPIRTSKFSKGGGCKNKIQNKFYSYILRGNNQQFKWKIIPFLTASKIWTIRKYVMKVVHVLYIEKIICWDKYKSPRKVKTTLKRAKFES